MQRERSALDSFPEPIDLNQGSIPNNTSTMDHSSSWDNTLNPVENRLSNYMLGSTDGNITCTNTANDTCRNFRSWDRGESSSSANDTQNGDNLEMNLGWSSFFDSCPGPDPTSENWSFEPPSNTGTTSSGLPSTQNYSANRATALNLNSNNGPHSLYKPGNSEIEQIPTFYASSNNLGAFSGSSSASGENNDAPGSSFATWGSSCKRKALEGTSGQFYPPGGSSNSNQQIDKNVIQHPVPGCYASRRNLSISSSDPLDLSPTNYSEHINSSSGVGMSRQTPGFFPSLSSGLSESPARNLTSRSNHRRHESVLFDTTPRITSSSNFDVYSSESRSPMTIATNPNSALNQPRSLPLNEARGGMHPYPWNGSFGSQGGSSSGVRDEVVNVRTSRRNNNLEYPLNASGLETRNAPQDQIDWSFVPGNSLTSRNHSSGSRAGSGSSSGRASLAAWSPHQNPMTSQNHRRLSEIAPWIPFHRGESDSGIRRSHFAHLPSSSDEAGPSSRAQRQLDQRSSGFLMDMPGEDINGWRSLAAVEGRHRLIRQVLTAMRRGVHLQAEDYMLVDPFMNGFAELHDRHRDMRLDVDNMSYEELLALEEQIGNVSTGLSEERIRGSMKQRKFESMGFLSNLEPCCVCQENYINGDDIGILDCGHEFHTGCIKQWLTLKNLCPICKMKALQI